MIVLGSSDTLRARLSAAATTTNPAFLFSYGDEPNPAGPATGSNPGAFDGITNITLVDSPDDGLSRVVKSGFIYNGDTADVTVIVEFYDGTTARQLTQITITPGATLSFGDAGFTVAGGEIQVNWGDVGGTLSDQTDLQDALDAASACDWIIALGDETTAITTGTAKVTVRAPRAMTLSKVKASLSTAGTGSSAFDVNKNGTSIFSTTLTIDASEKTSETAATPAVLSTTAIAADDELTFDIDTAGASAAGAKITLVATA